jgi:hypothetical protein
VRDSARSHRRATICPAPTTPQRLGLLRASVLACTPPLPRCCKSRSRVGSGRRTLDGCRDRAPLLPNRWYRIRHSRLTPNRLALAHAVSVVVAVLSPRPLSPAAVIVSSWPAGRATRLRARPAGAGSPHAPVQHSQSRDPRQGRRALSDSRLIFRRGQFHIDWTCPVGEHRFAPAKPREPTVLVQR